MGFLERESSRSGFSPEQHDYELKCRPGREKRRSVLSVRRLSFSEFILNTQFPYGLTNLKVPVAGDEAFTPLPLPVVAKPFAPLTTPSFE